jgi:Apoptogenic protein 1
MSLLLKARPHVPQRLFHSSVCAKHLVGPPDPLSNFRPVIYDDYSSPSSSSLLTQSNNSKSLQHPYSLEEFSGDVRDYQWKLQRQQLDAFDHLFWSDVSSVCSLNLATRLKVSTPTLKYLLSRIDFLPLESRTTTDSKQPRQRPSRLSRQTRHPRTTNSSSLSFAATG